MSILPDQLIELLHDNSSLKFVATVDQKNVPNVVVNDSVTTLDGETIAFAEEHDSYASQKNLVASIWFDKTVAIGVSRGDQHYQVKGTPHKCLITGTIFQKFLEHEREIRGPLAEIAAVWLVKPSEIRYESPERRRDLAEADRPQFNTHLESLLAR